MWPKRTYSVGCHPDAPFCANFGHFKLGCRVEKVWDVALVAGAGGWRLLGRGERRGGLELELELEAMVS